VAARVRVRGEPRRRPAPGWRERCAETRDRTGGRTRGLALEGPGGEGQGRGPRVPRGGCAQAEGRAPGTGRIETGRHGEGLPSRYGRGVIAPRPEDCRATRFGGWPDSPRGSATERTGRGGALEVDAARDDELTDVRRIVPQLGEGAERAERAEMRSADQVQPEARVRILDLAEERDLTLETSAHDAEATARVGEVRCVALQREGVVGVPVQLQPPGGGFGDAETREEEVDRGHDREVFDRGRDAHPSPDPEVDLELTPNSGPAIMGQPSLW